MIGTDHLRAVNQSVRLLQVLGLTSVQLRALARQGFVACESRGAGGQYFKLRFRIGDRQVVRGLGSDPSFASQVESAILELQNGRRRELEVSRVVSEAALMLRAVKDAVREPLAEHGLYFHGHAIRRARSDRRTTNTQQADT